MGQRFSPTGREALLRLRFAFDKQETDQLQREVSELQADLTQLEQASTRAATTTTGNVRRTGQEVRTQTDNVDESNKRLANSYGDVSSTAGALAAVLPGVGQEFANLLSDITQLGEYAPRAVSGIKSVGVETLALGVGLVALGGAMAFFNDSNNRASQTVNALIATNEEYFRLLRSGTREQLEAALEQAQLERDIAQDQINYNREIFAQLEAAISPVGRAIADIANLAGTGSLRSATTELETNLFAQDFLIRRLNQALENNATAVTDAAAAAQAAAEAEAAHTEQLIQLTLQYQGQSSDAIRDQINALVNEVAVRNELGTISSEYTDGIIVQMDALGRLIPLAEERERLLAKEEQRIANYNALAEANFALIEAQAEAQEILNEQFADYNALLASQAEILAEGAAEVAAINAEAQAEIAGIQADAQEDAADALEDHLDSLAAIQERYDDAAGDAIANRDALAFTQAKKARAREEDQAEDSYEDQQEQLEEALADQLQSQQQAQQQALQAQNQSQQQALQSAQQSYAQQAAQNMQAYQQAQVNLANAQYGVQNATQVHYLNLAGIAYNGMYSIETIMSAAFQRIANLANFVLNPSVGVGSPVTPGTPGQVGFGAPGAYGAGSGGAERYIRGIARDEFILIKRAARTRVR